MFDTGSIINWRLSFHFHRDLRYLPSYITISPNSELGKLPVTITEHRMRLLQRRLERGEIKVLLWASDQSLPRRRYGFNHHLHTTPRYLCIGVV